MISGAGPSTPPEGNCATSSTSCRQRNNPAHRVTQRHVVADICIFPLIPSLPEWNAFLKKRDWNQNS